MGTLPSWLASVDPYALMLASRAAALLRAVATALRHRIIKVSTVARIDADVFQRLAFWADVAVLLGHNSRAAAKAPRPAVGLLFRLEAGELTMLGRGWQLFASPCGKTRNSGCQQAQSGWFGGGHIKTRRIRSANAAGFI